MNVGERIKNRRKELGMSAEDLADKLGVSPSTIYRYESSQIMSMRTDKVAPIAEALNTTAAALMGWDSTDYLANEVVIETIKKPGRDALSERAARYMEFMDQLNEEGQEKLLEYARMLIKSGYIKKGDQDGLLEDEA